MPSRKDEAFMNFQLSIRGDIRKPPNCLTWVGTLSKICPNHNQVTIGSVLKEWNLKDSGFSKAGLSARGVQ